MATAYSAEYFREMQFFFGVVEDRDDPMRLGRVRVRAFGIHTEDKGAVPTESLPWAQLVMPCTSASISGIGDSPTGMVEGSWVFGFFADGVQMQIPMILGTMIGAPEALPDTSVGFYDPNGIYPRVEIAQETDVNRLARGTDINASTLESQRAGESNLAQKKANRITGVKVAMPPGSEGEPGKKDGVPISVKDGAPAGKDPAVYFSRSTWNEPNPRYGGQNEGEKAPMNIHGVRNPVYKQGRPSYENPNYGNESRYPLNHVNVTEIGHIFEVDDSPRAERIHQYHVSGSFTEIQPNGTRVTKIVGDDYEMVMHDKNVGIWGNVNITVHNSDLRLYVTKEKISKKGGDLYIETDGDFNLNVKGDMTTKVQGTEYKEIKTDSATNIEGKHSLRVAKDQIVKINQNRRTNIRENDEKVVGKTEDVMVRGEAMKKVHLSTMTSSGNNYTIAASNNITQLAQSNVNIKTEANYNLDATLKIDMDASDDIELDTPTNFEVGGTSTPAQTTIKGTRIDLNP